MSRMHKGREGEISGSDPDRAIIDIGSNTVRLVVYGGSRRAPIVLLNEKVAAQLGKQVSIDGAMSPEAMDTAYGALSRYALLLSDLDVPRIDVVATSAVREASNGKEFLARIEELGFAPRVLSGEEEADVSAYGVMGAFPGAHGTVADLGGGSLELVSVENGEATQAETLPLGTLKLARMREHDPDSWPKSIAKILKGRTKGDADKPLYLVGGTFRAMAVLAMDWAGSPLSDPHGLSTGPDEAMTLLKRVAKSDPDSLAGNPRISSMRAAKLPDAAALLQALIKAVGPSRIVFSSWGLREGLLFHDLAPALKGQDPLLAGVAHFGTTRGAPPMLAARIAGWTVAATPPDGAGSERLRLAATTLALASMQIEPNLRLKSGMEWALHKRWLAIKPYERAMLAAAIAANGNNCELDYTLHALASKEQLEEAICWGLGVRLCRRLGGSSRKSLQASALRIERNRLILRLEEGRQALFGAPTEKDLKLLGNRLGLDYDVSIVPDGASLLTPQDAELA